MGQREPELCEGLGAGWLPVGERGQNGDCGFPIALHQPRRGGEIERLDAVRPQTQRSIRIHAGLREIFGVQIRLRQEAISLIIIRSVDRERVLKERDAVAPKPSLRAAEQSERNGDANAESRKQRSPQKPRAHGQVEKQKAEDDE